MEPGELENGATSYVRYNGFRKGYVLTFVKSLFGVSQRQSRPARAVSLGVGRARPAHTSHQCIIFYPAEKERREKKIKTRYIMQRKVGAKLFRR
jgi:hypothetical protein